MWHIIGIYRGESEIIDTAESKDEANQLVTEYRMAFGSDWIIKKVRKWR